MEDLKQKTTTPDKEEKEKKPISTKKPDNKKRAHEDFKRKYFDYYDDVKTNIKQDW